MVCCSHWRRYWGQMWPTAPPSNSDINDHEIRVDPKTFIQCERGWGHTIALQKLDNCSANWMSISVIQYLCTHVCSADRVLGWKLHLDSLH